MRLLAPLCATLLLLATPGLFGCGSETTSTPSNNANNNADPGDTGGNNDNGGELDVGDDGSPQDDAPPDAQWDFEALVASFGDLDTVAGRGEEREKDFNGWEPRFESGPALDAELSRPHMTLGDDAGNLYIADKDAHAVRKVTPGGIIVTVAGTNAPGDDGDTPGPGVSRALNGPNGLWVRGDGTVYILDLNNQKIRRLSVDGELTTLFDVPGLSIGRGLWVNDEETLAYVSSGGALLKWTPSTGVSTLASGFSSLGNISVSATGEIAVADRSGHRVYRVFEDGGREVMAGSGETGGGGDGQAAIDTGLNEVRGVWHHPRGGFFVATHKGGQVWYVDTKGVIHLFIDGDTDHTHAGDGEPFHTPGRKISEPRAVTMDRAGNVIITENDHGYVRIVRAR